MIGDLCMNGIVLYQSKYGSAKKYAEWISAETGFECIETKKADIKEVVKYDIVVLCGGIYTSGIAGLSFFKKNIGKLSGKKLAVLFCCASPYDENAVRQLRDFNMKDALSDIPLFYGRGAWDMEAMSFKDRTLCSMLQKAVAGKEPEKCEIWEKALLEAGTEKHDWTDKKYIEPLIAYINS